MGVTLPRGTFVIGPSTGALTLHTARSGFGAAAGHDLEIEVTRWTGTLSVDADNLEASIVEVIVDATSFEVRGGTGSPVPLLAVNKAEIVRTVSRLLRTEEHQEIRFVSAAVVAVEGGYLVGGNLSIAGTTRPVELTVTLDDHTESPSGTITGTVRHSDFGIKPYSAMFGALKVRDAVEVRAAVRLA